MFVLSRDVSASYRVIATLVATAVIMWTLGVSHFAQAANITDVYDLLSDTAPNAQANHEIEFVSPSGVATSTGTIVVTFPTGANEFDLTGVVAGDIDLELDGVDQDLTGTDWSVAVGASTITFTSVGNGVQPGATTTIFIGTNATGGTNQIDNPDPATGNQSYEIDISAGTDTGATRVVILDTVLVTAQVATSFTFEVEGNGDTEPVNGETTTEPSSSTTIPFGSLDAGTPVVLSQDLIVNTNAINGFVVTVEEDQHLESETGADIDNFANNNNSVIPALWGTLAADIDDENTWGHWGITSEDATTTRTNEFGNNTWLGVSTTPSVIFSHDGPADGVTAGVGSTTIGFKVEITALQEAADDYTTTLTYIATPTF
jgi:hypothetical protein